MRGGLGGKGQFFEPDPNIHAAVRENYDDIQRIEKTLQKVVMLVKHQDKAIQKVLIELHGGVKEKC